MYRERIDNVINSMKDFGLKKILIGNPISIKYLTGVKIDPMERFFALYLSIDGDHKLFLNNMFTVGDTEVGQVWMSDTDDAMKILSENIDATGTLGVDRDWPARFLLRFMQINPDVKCEIGSQCVDTVRSCKDQYECEKMRAASVVNDKCMDAVSKHIHDDVTEIDCVKFINKQYEICGATGYSFPSIVSFGANAADPHHVADETVLKKGDCILIDMGCILDGYCSDMTRVFFWKEADDRYIKIHNIVREANEIAEKMIKPGVRFCDIDKAARDYISSFGYGDKFIHRLGHSIGIECHEPGDVGGANTDEVKPGMTFSIEPGVYLPGEFGVRIEDLIIVRDDGAEILNHLDKHVKILG